MNPLRLIKSAAVVFLSLGVVWAFSMLLYALSVGLTSLLLKRLDLPTAIWWLTVIIWFGLATAVVYRRRRRT